MRKDDFLCRQRPSAAKAGLMLRNLAARLEAAPFQNGLHTAFFRKWLRTGLNSFAAPRLGRGLGQHGLMSQAGPKGASLSG